MANVLIQLIESRDLSGVLAMASSPLLTGPLTPEGDTCLHLAVKSDHVDMIVLLASLTADDHMIDLVNNDGQTPLITACRAHPGFVSQGVIRALVGLGANVNANYLVKRMVPSRWNDGPNDWDLKDDFYDISPLALASKRGEIDLVHFLMERGARFWTSDLSDLVHHAIAFDYVEMVRLFLSLGFPWHRGQIDFDGLIDSQNTDLHELYGHHPYSIDGSVLFCHLASDEMLRLLIDHGASLDVCQKDSSDRITTLAEHWICWKRLDLILYGIEMGLDVCKCMPAERIYCLIQSPIMTLHKALFSSHLIRRTALLSLVE